MRALETDDPRVIGEYRLLRRLGAGGMGRVYLGRSPGGRTVAVKVVHPHFAEDEEFRVRFRREVESARRVGGDWTAPVLAADPDARVPWVATGYVAGPPLRQAVTEQGPLPETAVRALGAGLAEALSAVHGLGLVHRDIKPSNVLLTPDGPRLIDFGIARATDGTSALTSTGVSLGSPGYMSPEQVLGRGRVGPASDLFSLGAVLAFASTGEAPFPGDSSAALLYYVVHGEPEVNLPQSPLRDLVVACLAKEPADRPAPEDVAWQLAGPGGAAGLTTAGGWLPGVLLEQVSRQAAELLDLEAESAGQGPPHQRYGPVTGAGESPSGVVSFSHSGEPPRGLEWSGRTEGGGDPSYAPGDENVSGTPPTGTPSGGGFGPVGVGHGSGATDLNTAIRPGTSGEVSGERATYPLGGRPPGHDFGGGGAAELGGRPPGHDFRGGGSATLGRRQVSCSLVLSVAGVLAVALLASTFVFDLLPGRNGEGGRSGGQPPSAARPSDQASESASAGQRSVPKAFLGTWRGKVTSDSGIPGGTMTLTITNGTVGEKVVSSRVELGPLSCSGSWTLTSVAEGKLVTDASQPSAQPGCSKGGTRVTLRLREDGRLAFASNDEAGGNPTGTLRKIR